MSNHTDARLSQRDAGKPTPVDALRGRSRKILGEDQSIKTAVLVPLVQQSDGTWAVLFERRASTLRRQAGEVCFPGGHCDAADEDERATAIRETCEELRIAENDFECVAPLDVLVTNSRLLVYPFIGVIHRPDSIQPNPAEVAEVFTIPLNQLLAAQPSLHKVSWQPSPADDFPYHLIPNGRDYAWRKADVTQVFYEMDGRVIWGMTARILAHALDLIRTGKGEA